MSAIRSETLVWLLLVALTLLTWAIGQTGVSGTAVSLGLLAVALIKGHLVGDFFMGLRRVRGLWRWVIALWLLLPGGLIALAFVLAAR
ncbi:MAG TPA: cytochrome C oxidase subunit IV family protein [Thiohalobacter sp.]|nr:cytochrome C oxidase subunit IV family protein [Thiohalobacter sp.]